MEEDIIRGEIFEAGGEYIGAVGNYIAAILQTTGLYGQHDILSTFNELFQATGSLVYTVSLIGALISIALFGNYRMSLYLLVAPAMFGFVLSPVQVGPTDVQMGSRVNGAAVATQNKFLARIRCAERGFLGDQSAEPGVDLEDAPAGAHPDTNCGQTERGEDILANPQVAWLFVRFDNLVSQIVQNLVSLLLDEENRKDLLNVARERAVSKILSARGQDPGYVQLVSLGAMGQCAEATSLKAQLAEVREEVSDISRELGGISFPIAPWDNNTQRRADILESELAHSQQKEERLSLIYSERMRDTIPLRDHTRAYLLRLSEGRRGVPENVTCTRLWQMILGASLAESYRQIDRVSQEEAEGVPWEDLRRELMDFFPPGGVNLEDRPEAAAHIVAAYILRNTLKYSTHGMMRDNVFQKIPFHKRKSDWIFNEVAGADARGLGFKLMYFGGAIPYMQGLLLYLLAVAFPFFSIFLLMPGRISAFFVWLALWVWVKSWDVGFALTHFLRDYLWDVLSLGVHDNQFIEWENPSAVYQFISQNDPMAHQNTYYTIISLVTISVPYLTAHLCMGATNLFDAFKTSIDTNVDRFGQRGNRYYRHELWNERQDIVKRFEEGAVEKAWADYELAAATGDKTAANDMLARYKREVFKANFNNEAVQQRGMQAAVYDRRMLYTVGQGSNILESNTWKMNRPLLTRPVGSGTSGFASDSANPGVHSDEVSFMQPGGMSGTGEADADGDGS